MIKKITLYITTITSSLLFIFTILIIIIGTIAIKNNRLVKVFGYSYSIVATESMVPTIKRGAIIIVKEKNFDNVQVGDVVVYKSEQYQIYIVHRVIEINDDGQLITQGDNNSSPDTELVSAEKFHGVVVNNFNFLNLGQLVLKDRNLIFMFVILIFIIMIVSEIINIIKNVKKDTEEKLKDKLNEEKALEYERTKEEIRKELIEELKDKQ